MEKQSLKFKSILFLILLLTMITSAHADVIGQIIPLVGSPVIHGKPDIRVTAPTDINFNDTISIGRGVNAIKLV